VNIEFHSEMALYNLTARQKFPAAIESLWDFISSPANLKIITPDYMGFEVISKSLPEKIYRGMIINYKVSPLLGIKLNWVTEITELKEYEYFVDEQTRGPYRLWHHKHILEKIEGGVLMTDIINYRPPFSFIGNISNSLIVRKKLNGIFNYRRKKLEEIFGRYPDK
jgi:ligand-binding SRPBCC domain-containing protein